ncbi:hypothetical protein M8320_18535 [Leclercia sp. H6W5]|uniref:hypothetical protein n=1 Tax=Leclercia tamurae TaxID=2926467 RepID=UPI0021D30569|nr:hypothetical protein [Leclercia tamurae]MCU6683993.1 hypothetical protein [Leclercia tamurae]
MGCFDAWLTDELGHKREEPANDSTQAEATTPTEENTGGDSEAKPEHSISFSNLEASTSSVRLILMIVVISLVVMAKQLIMSLM